MKTSVTGIILSACIAFVSSPLPLFAEEAPHLPAFDLPVIANTDRETLGADDLLGKVTYIDFWASWCGPCRLSLPALDAIYRDLKDQGFQAVAISVDVVEEDALDFFDRYPITYPALIDTSGDVAKQFAVNGMPSGYLVGRNGEVISVHVGFRPGDETALRQEILTLLAEAPASH